MFRASLSESRSASGGPTTGRSSVWNGSLLRQKNNSLGCFVLPDLSQASQHLYRSMLLLLHRFIKAKYLAWNYDTSRCHIIRKFYNKNVIVRHTPFCSVLLSDLSDEVYDCSFNVFRSSLKTVFHQRFDTH